MAQPIYCDQEEDGNLAFIVVSFYNTPITEAVCLACLPQWLVDLMGAVKGNLGDEVVAGIVSAIIEANPPNQPPPESPSDGPGAARELSAFPGTAHVKKSTHGHRGGRSGPIDDPPDDAETSVS